MKPTAVPVRAIIFVVPFVPLLTTKFCVAPVVRTASEENARLETPDPEEP